MNESKHGTKINLQPCHCKSCCGTLKDRRTIRKHFSNGPYPQTSEENPCSPTGSTSYSNYAHGTVHVSGRYHVMPSSSSNLFSANEEIPTSDTNERSPRDIEGEDDGIVNEIHGSDISHVSGASSVSSHLFSAVEESCMSDHDSCATDIDVESGEIENGSDSSHNSVENSIYTDNEIDRMILRLIESKVKYGWSQEETMSQIRNIYELIRDDRVPHRSWDALFKFLVKLGYKNPKHYKVCCDSNDHVTLLEHKEDCPNCGCRWDNCQDYFVLGLQLESYFLDEKTMKDHLAHWENKSDWLNKDNINVNYKEIWHGARFRELSYFWDESSEVYCPVCCPNCKTVISVEEIISSVAPGNTLHDPVYLSCKECFFDFVHQPVTMKGCPLNQALIFHEDGFNAFVQKSRGIAAIHISSACITKEQRTSGEYLRVYSFIPTFSLQEGISHKLDAFLKPMINEIKDLYLNGICVTVHQQIHLKNGTEIQPGNYHVRALILLGTADLKGHQEITLYAGGGRIGCRRCLVNGTYIAEKRHYYYGNFGGRFRHPCQIKTSDYHKFHGKRVDSAMTAAERSRLQTETGVSGLSVLFELHSLYGFDPIQDMTIDRMHLTFNMLKREFTDKIWAELGPNADRLVNARHPGAGGLIDHGDFGAALDAVCWPTEEKESGVAKLKSLTDKLGSWKSNEFKKFSAVAREILAEKIPSRAYHSYILLCDAVQMLYSRELRNVGWSNQNIERLDGLLWSHAIKAEELYGLDFCTENLEYSIHAGSEIKRHSSMDNYSCELYERAIRIHKKQKHNSKGLEKTFVTRECLRNFIECYKREHGPISNYPEGEASYSFQMDILNIATPFFFHEHSFKAAVSLLDDVKECQHPRIKHALKYGIALGNIKAKSYANAILNDIKRFFATELGLQNQEIPNNLQTPKSVVVIDQFQEKIKVTKSDVCRIQSRNGNEEWIMTVQDILLVGPLQGRYYTFVNGPYFIPAFHNGQIAYHQWTDTPKYIQRIYNLDSVQPIAFFKRKVIMYPEPMNVQNPSYFLCVDYKNPELVNTVHVPIYPDVSDTVKVQGTKNEVWYGKVGDVNYDERKATLQWYKETRRNGIWVLMNKEDRVSFTSIIGLAVVDRTFGGFSIVDV